LKKVLIGIGVLLVALVVVALVVPNFVDLNQYKGQVTSQVRAVTGRDLIIAGDIELSVLPSIALKADDIRLSNAEGASAADMVTLKGLRVRVALLPLLGGDLQVESIILSEPVIEIESFADGGTNLEFRPEVPAGGAEPTSGNEAGGVAVSEQDQAIRLDSVVIQDGTVIFRDQAAGTIERIENLDLTLKAASLKGPFEAEGSMTARGLPLELALKTGRMGDGPMAVAFSLGAMEERGRLRFNGALSEMGPDGELSGRLEAESRDLRALLAAFMQGNGGMASGLPAGLAQPFNLESSVSLSQFGGNLGDMELALGETRATGALNLALAEQPRADLALVVGTMDLDALLAGEAPAQVGGDSTATAPLAAATKAENGGQPDTPEDGAGLPEGIAASVDLIIDAVAYNGAILRNLRANAVLDNGEITVNQIGALLPGGSELSVFGFVGLPGGQPRFEGTVELASDNARALLEWFKVDVAAVPADRLRKLDLAASVIATAEQVQISDTRIALDSSNITGGVTVALRDRPAFGLSVNLDRINIDAYMLADRVEATTTEEKPANGAAAGGAGTAKEEPKGFAALTAFDANIQARIGRLTYNDVPVRGVAFDGTLYDGVLTVNGFSIEDLAGAQAAVAGTVGGFDGTPTVKGTVDLSAADVGPVAQLVGVDLPIPASQIGAVTLKGSADTDGNRVTMDMKLDAVGGSASVAGTVSDIATAPRYDVTIDLNHPQPAQLFALVPGGTPPNLSDLEALGLRASLKGGPGGEGGQDMTVDLSLRLAGGSMTGKGNVTGLGAVVAYDLDIAAEFPDFVRLVRSLSPDYRPAGQNLGGVKLLAAIKGNETAATLSTFQGAIGPVSLKGKGAVDLAGVRPSLVAEISTSEVVADQFMAAKAGGGGGSSGGSGGGGSATGGGKGGEHWSRDTIDFSGLLSIDAEIKVAMPALTYDAYRIVNPRIDLGIKDGVATLRSATGQIFGGAIAASGQVAGAGQVPALNMTISADGVDVAEALKTLADTDRASGMANLQFQVESLGASEFDLVSNLNGAGQVSGDIRVQAKQEEAAGTALLGILSTQIRELQGIAGVTTSVLTAFGSGPAALSGTYQIQNGIVATNDTLLASSSGRASATGIVDLPRWLIDMNAAVNVSGKAEPVFTAQARGPLDEPDIKVGGQAFTAGAQGGLGVLQQLVPGLGGLTGSSSAAPPPDAAAPEAAPQEPAAQPEDVTPQKFIKDILKGLGG
jgi:uncharacterized protein involved in outer membrane biogenesis